MVCQGINKDISCPNNSAKYYRMRFQGKTLKKVIVGIRKLFVTGRFHTTASRLRFLENLFVISLQVRAITVAKEIKHTVRGKNSLCH